MGEHVSESFSLNFGKYEVPSDLQLLLSIEEELRAVHPQSLDFAMGLILETSSFRYFCTPCDVVVFGSNGCDGIHYGYLTDFGEAESLDEAPIVCISPMDFGDTNKLIAKNFRDFLSLNFTDSALFFNLFESEDAYRAQASKWEEEALASPYRNTPEEQKLKADLQKKIRDAFDLPIIDNPYTYIEELQAERAAKALFHTQDTLHILTRSVEQTEIKEEDALLVQQIEPENHEEVAVWLDKLSPPAALALIRHVEMNDSVESRQVLKQYLQEIGYEDEALRMEMAIQNLSPDESEWLYSIETTGTVYIKNT
ncbi:hypothetical protein M3231_26365 [Neobacillus mesonae]|nr:hypothetical protein [Neobacillus mesonae]